MPASSKWSLYLKFPHQNPVYPSPLTHTCCMPCPPHSSRVDHQTKLGEDYRSLSSSLCSFLHSPVTSSLLCPYVLLSTLFSNTLSLLPTFIDSDQVSHPYKTTGNTVVLYILIFKFLDSKLEDKRFYTK